jgi:hypothetical protein
VSGDLGIVLLAPLIAMMAGLSITLPLCRRATREAQRLRGSAAALGDLGEATDLLRHGADSLQMAPRN